MRKFANQVGASIAPDQGGAERGSACRGREKGGDVSELHGSEFLAFLWGGMFSIMFSLVETNVSGGVKIVVCMFG